jgi:hypothetical protein
MDGRAAGEDDRVLTAILLTLVGRPQLNIP